MLLDTNPALEFVRNSSMPLIVLTFSSIFFAIELSISSGLAPGNCAWTLT